MKSFIKDDHHSCQNEKEEIIGIYKKEAEEECKTPNEFGYPEINNDKLSDSDTDNQ